MRLLREAFRDLRANRGRSLLAAGSLFVALIALVAVATVGTVIKDVFMVQQEQLFGRLPVRQANFEWGQLSADRLETMLTEFESSISDTGGRWMFVGSIDATVAPVNAEGTIGERSAVGFSLAAGDLDRIRRLPVLDGEWIELNNVRYPGGLVVNQAASEMLGGVGSRVSVTFTVPDMDPRRRPFDQRVATVISDGSPEPHVYQSLSFAAHLDPTILADVSPTLSVHYPGGASGDIDATINAIADRLGVPTDNRSISTPGGIESMLSFLDVMRLAFGGVSAVTLFVSVIGLLNIGLATLRERIRELSLRRAVGATRLRVFGLVLSSTVILSLGTAVVAITAAWLGVEWYVPTLIDPASTVEAPGFPLPAALLGGGCALLAGVAGGLIPAIAAARVDMVQVLRE
ncbi:ABC transporter permease [Stackebrandtia soli]|uniref:ABC transporter permease n=1 Tax=Stackebrandtia soli TaxID=1892856 RepID=UPI0039ED2CBE